MSTELVTSNIASSVLDNIIEVNGTRRNYDSTSDERRCVILDSDGISSYKKKFSYNRGTLSDGQFAYLDEVEIYFRLPVNISMIASDSTDESYMCRASEIASSGKPSLHVFVNGLKIPDNEVLFYPTRTNVDVFVPVKYVSSNRTEFVIEKVRYDLTPYVRYYTNKTSNQNIVIPITEKQYEKAVVRDRTIQIFINKRLYTGSRSVTQSGKTSIIVSLFQEVRDAEVEMILDSSIQYFFPGVQQPIDDKVVYEIPETYLDSIHGPLSKFSCYFYVDGLRVPNTEIEQIGRLHFRYKLNEIRSAHISMCITDRNFINDAGKRLYGCDYYLYNMIGCSAITSAFQTGLSGTLFDGNIDFDEVLNKHSKQYDRQLLNDMLNLTKRLPTNTTRTAMLLENRPYLMRSFLENYGNEVYTYTMEYNGKDPFVYLGVPQSYELSASRNYSISINTNHVPINDVDIDDKGVTDVFKIDAKYFDIGENVIEILVINDLPIEYKVFKPSDIELDDGYSILKVSGFKRAMYADDICILQKVKNNDMYNYVGNSSVGYIPLTDAIVDIDDDGVINILFDTIPTSDIMVYNKNFSCVYRWTKPLTSDTMDITIPIFNGGESDPVLYIPRGKVEVYAGNNKLIEGIDYFVKHPLNEETAAGSFIIVTRAILPGTEFDIYFSNMKTKNVISKSGYFTNNKYGLFYLGSLKYPVSLKYLNIYLNNKRVSEADIDILSDKLIRIHSFNNPMYDLSVESTFSVEESDLEPFINIYKEDSFEKYIESLFKGVYYNRPFDPNEGDLPDFNAVYETFVDNVDSVGKEPNPLAREELWIPSDNDDPSVIGISNDGSAMGGENINCSVIAGGRAIFAGDKGRVASVQLQTLEWKSYLEGGVGILANDGSFVNNENITSVCFSKNYVIFGTEFGHIALYDIVAGKWHSINDTTFGLKINKLDSTIYPNTAIRSIYHYMNKDAGYDQLYIMGDGGNVATYDYATNEWIPYHNTTIKRCATVRNIMQNIYGCYVTKVNTKDVLVVYGSDGNIASCKLQDNAWTKPDGTYVDNRRPGTNIFNNGDIRNNSDIYCSEDYLVYKVFAGKDGIVSILDTTTNTFYSTPLETRNIANNGSHSLNNSTRAMICYDDSIIVTGSDLGKISNYSGEIQNWRSANSGSGIANNGEMMDHNGIRSIIYTISDTDYIIFSGEKGKICSYNVDVHEVPFRYDPYKTAFLKWYTTPGNAVISTIFDIDENLSRKFSMYHDSDSDDYDIVIGPGDMDLISDIYMNDLGTYPDTIDRRLRFIAEMIQEMGSGRYTLEQAYEYYINNKYCNILYERDLIPLKGSFLDVDYDIILT